MLRRIGCIAVLALGSCALIVFLVLSWMSRTAPAWYAPPDPQTPAIAALADDFEYEIVERTQRQRPKTEGEWSQIITEQQINAWLVNRLPKWVAHDSNVEWPAAIGTPQVRIETEGISIAVPIGEEKPRTVVAHILPTIENGQLRLTVDRVAIGRISMPGEPLKNLIKTIEDISPETLSDPGLQQAISILSGEQTIHPEVELQDGRCVRLVSLRLLPRKLELRAITESGNRSSAR